MKKKSNNCVAYTASIIVRMCVELGFLYIMNSIHGFFAYRVPVSYKCDMFPCPYTVDCFTSRPMEKGILMLLMLGLTLLSVILNFAELIYIFVNRCKNSRNKPSTNNQSTSEERDFV